MRTSIRAWKDSLITEQRRRTSSVVRQHFQMYVVRCLKWNFSQVHDDDQTLRIGLDVVVKQKPDLPECEAPTRHDFVCRKLVTLREVDNGFLPDDFRWVRRLRSE